MGKGDKKSRRGKIIIGSYGVRRPRKKKKYSAPEVVAVAEAEPIPVTPPAKPKKPAKTKGG
jgi:30S ribosomal protein S31